MLTHFRSLLLEKNGYAVSSTQVQRLACWTRASVAAAGWNRDGVDCATVADTDEVLAARAYIKGRGGDPCVRYALA